MTPEQINEAVAKVDGYYQKEVFHWPFGVLKTESNKISNGLHWHAPETNYPFAHLPSYTTSYDAILPVIQRLDLDTQYHIDTTPLQLCVALLEALNLYDNQQR